MIYNSHPSHKDDAYRSLRDLKPTVASAVKAFKPYVEDFDSIVVTGMSGAIVGSPVSLRLGKPLVVVRKPDDGSHAYTLLINDSELGERALFLDDFISSGDTFVRVKAALPGSVRITHTYLYREDEVNVV